MNIDTKFLLVCLQLIIVLLLMSVNAEGLAHMGPRRRVLSDEVSPQSASSSPKYSALSATSPIARAYRLHNLRAKADIVLDKDRVSATALNSDERGELGLESVMMENKEIRTRIRGLVTDTYLCFNHKGRLVAKPKGRARGAKCEFIEHVNPETGSSSFKSALNPKWQVGFNLKGHGLLGSSFEGSQCLECFLFIKASINTPARKNPPPSHLTHRNFSPLRHNQMVGEYHPGVNPDIFSSYPLLPPPQSSHWRKVLTSTTTSTPRPTKQPARHRLRHRKKKHRHNHQHAETTTLRPFPNGDQF